MLLDYHIPPAVYVGRIDRIAPLTACFVYIPFANEKRLLVDPEVFLPGIDHRPTEPDQLHMTLLWSESCTDEQAAALVELISKPMRFSVETARLGVLEGGSKPALVWMINPGPALIRLQTSIYNAALNVGIPISEYSVPGIFTPHITAAYNLERVPDELPQVEPFRIMVDQFIIGRDEYRHLFTVTLPRGVADEPYIERHGDHIGQEGLPGGGSQPGYSHAGGSVSAIESE